MSAPVVLSYGAGVDSTAMLVELCSTGRAPDLVIKAETGSDKPENDEYTELMADWLARRGVRFERVAYVPKRFAHWPPYYSLVENVLTNGTLPSISLGRHSCSLKWKVAPIDKFLAGWEPARAAWARGEKVVRLIGYNADPRDTARFAHARSIEDPKYHNSYPLQLWGWTRPKCVARIQREGLPVPVKSSCFLCGAMRPEEVDALPAWCLRVIVLVEARAAPRLRTVEGLWRKSTKKRPGRMTDYIRARGLLDAAEVDWIVEHAPTQLQRFQERHAALPIEERPAIREWLDRFLAGADMPATPARAA